MPHYLILKRVIFYFCLLIISSMGILACKKKELFGPSLTKVEKSISVNITYNSFVAEIGNIDKLLLQLKISDKTNYKNIQISATSTNGINETNVQAFEIDTTKIIAIKNKNETYFSMRLNSKKDSSNNCFYNLYVKKDSNNQISQTIIKFLPSAKSIKTNYKNFEAQYFILQNSMERNVKNKSNITLSNKTTLSELGNICYEVAFDFPCNNNYVHEQNGPGPWCDVNGSYRFLVMDCESSGTTSTGWSGIGNSNGISTTGNVIVSGNIVISPSNNNNTIITCEVPETDEFINQLYTENIVWASQNVNLFNQICGSLCGNNSEKNKENAQLAIGYYIKLKPILDSNPDALLPCDSLNMMPLKIYGPMFQRVGSFIVPQNVKNSLDSVNLFFSGTNLTPFRVQDLDYGTSTFADVNCDYFPVRIKTMPNGFTPKSLLDYFRININSFINGTPDVTFLPYNFLNLINYTNWYNSPYQNSIGSVVSIHDQMVPFIIGVNATVVVSDYYSSDILGEEKARFKFATISAPLNGVHPVSGNREFGIFADPRYPGEYSFYTMGVDRVSNILGTIASDLTNLGYERADKLWTRIQEQMVSFIIANGSTVEFYTPKNIKARPNWNDVKEFLKNQIDFAELKRRLGC